MFWKRKKNWKDDDKREIQTVLNTNGNCYAGGWVADEMIYTENQVKSLIGFISNNPIAKNVQKGQKFKFWVGYPVMRIFMVIPTALGKPVSLIDLRIEQFLNSPSGYFERNIIEGTNFESIEIVPNYRLFKIENDLMFRVIEDTTENVQIQVDGVMCTVWQIRNLVPSAGYMSLQITF